MSQSLRNLKGAVREFVNRPIDEDIDPNEVRDVLDELEGELDLLYESPEERAAVRAEAEALARKIVSGITKRPSLQATYKDLGGRVGLGQRTTRRT